MNPSFTSLLLAASVLCASGVSITSDKSIIRSQQRAKANVKEDEEGTCESKWDFDLGTDSCDCREVDRRVSEEECLVAAVKAGATTLHDEAHFKVSEYYEHRRPMGCFKFACLEDPRGICYFWNGVASAGPKGEGPAKCTEGAAPVMGEPVPDVEGTPVCKRPYYKNGAVDDNGGCPTGYEVIQSEDSCTSAALCLGRCTGNKDLGEFRKGVHNQSERNDFPEGCFTATPPSESVAGCVYINPRSEALGLPTSPKGTVLCKVSSTVNYTSQATGNTVTAEEAVHSVSTPAPSPATMLIRKEATSAPTGGEALQEHAGEQWHLRVEPHRRRRNEHF